MGKHKTYKYFKLRESVYANKFPEPMVGVTKARNWIREHLDVKKLPKGIEIW